MVKLWPWYIKHFFFKLPSTISDCDKMPTVFSCDEQLKTSNNISDGLIPNWMNFLIVIVWSCRSKASPDMLLWPLTYLDIGPTVVIFCLSKTLSNHVLSPDASLATKLTNINIVTHILHYPIFQKNLKYFWPVSSARYFALIWNCLQVWYFRCWCSTEHACMVGGALAKALCIGCWCKIMIYECANFGVKTLKSSDMNYQ
jgi:hypothetical protein